MHNIKLLERHERMHNSNKINETEIYFMKSYDIVEAIFHATLQIKPYKNREDKDRTLNIIVELYNKLYTLNEDRYFNNIKKVIDNSLKLLKNLTSAENKNLTQKHTYVLFMAVDFLKLLLDTVKRNSSDEELSDSTKQIILKVEECLEN